jgi:hypothetical protein
MSGGIAPPFLTLALDGVEWSTSHPSHFTPWEIAHSNHWIVGWVDPRASLDTAEKKKISCPGWESNPDHPAHHSTDWAIPAPHPTGLLLLLLLLLNSSTTRNGSLLAQEFPSIAPPSNWYNGIMPSGIDNQSKVIFAIFCPLHRT